MVLTKHSCGCVGAVLGTKASTFVRFAEIRENKVEEDKRPCPDHKQGSGPS